MVQDFLKQDIYMNVLLYIRPRTKQFQEELGDHLYKTCQEDNQKVGLGFLSI